MFFYLLGGIKMIDYLRNLFISWFNKILNWFSERHKKKEMNTKKEIPFDKNKHADDDRQKRISEGFQALDECCKSIANLRAEIEMSQTNNDLDAPVPANNNIKNNLEENNMGLLQSKVIKFLGGTPAPTSEDECKQQIKELEKKKLKFQNKEGVAPIKPVGQEKLLSSNISPISMRSNNDNSNWMDPNDLNNTFEYQDEKVQKAMKGENNKMGELINKKAEEIKQDVKKEMDDRFAESTNNINQLKEDMKEVKKDIKDIKDEQIDLKKMIARSDEMIADNKRRLDKAEKMLEDMKEERKDTKRMLAKMEEDKKVHDELMAALWNKLDEWNGIKQPTREGSDNRESTNTSLSSFKYKNPFRNNKRQPKMERADMAHSYDDNE